MTSRAEYRLVLRQDNADLRLTEKGYEIGLVTEERYQRFLEKKELVAKETERIAKTVLKPEDVNDLLVSKGSTPLNNPAPIIEIMRRPQITYDDLAPFDPERPALSEHQKTMMEVQVKYEGYIEKQQRRIDKFRKLEGRKLSADLDYNNIDGLRIEAQQKLTAIKPLSIGQASRISGVSPADINVLLIWLEKEKRNKNG